MKITSFFSIACLALAVPAALAATAGALEKRQSAIATQTGVGTGFAKAEAAEDELARGVSEGPVPELDLRKFDSETVEQLSAASYRAEPLNVTAVRNLGLLQDARGNADSASNLMQMSRRLSRRDLSTNTWLVRDNAGREDQEGLLKSFDYSLRTSNSARDLLLPALVQTLSTPEMVDQMLPLLRQNPNWEQFFWERAHSVQGSLPAVVDLRIARRNDGYDPPPGFDARIMQQLVRTAQFEDAKRLHDNLYRSAEAQGIVRNPSFANEIGIVPFDWDIQFDSDLQARIRPDAGDLVFSLYGKKQKIIARQLIDVPAGVLTLAANVSGKDAGDVRVLVRCAQTSTGQAVAFDTSQKSYDFTLRGEAAEGSCRFYWLEIVMTNAERRGVREAAISELRIRPRNSSDAN